MQKKPLSDKCAEEITDIFEEAVDQATTNLFEKDYTILGEENGELYEYKMSFNQLGFKEVSKSRLRN